MSPGPDDIFLRGLQKIITEMTSRNHSPPVLISTQTFFSNLLNLVPAWRPCMPRGDLLCSTRNFTRVTRSTETHRIICRFSLAEKTGTKGKSIDVFLY